MELSRDSAYEMLSITRNINYIGKLLQENTVVFKPYLFMRDGVCLALYGLGYMKETILMPILKSGNYTIEPIPQDVYSSHKVLKVLLFHQNRHKVRSILPRAIAKEQ